VKFNILIRSVVLLLVPAITSADRTTLFDLMKEVYDPMIAEQQNLTAFTWNEFDENDTDEMKLGGKGWVFENNMGGNQEGIGARGERDDLPVAGFQRWEQGIVEPKYHYGTWELTGPMIMSAKKNVEAFANSQTSEMQRLTKDVIKDLNRVIWGDGTGQLGLVKSDEGGNEFQVSGADSIYFRLNMVIDVFIVLTSGIRDSMTGRTVDAMVVQADGDVEITYSGVGQTVVAGDMITREGARLVGGAVNNEILGIRAAVDDGTVLVTYHGVSRTLFPLFKGNVLDNGGTLRNVSLDLHQQACDAIVEMGGEEPDWCRMNQGQRRKFFDLVAPDVRFQPMEFKAGFRRLSYNGVEITIDIDHPREEITYLTRNKFKKYTMFPLGILDLDGQTMRQVVNKDVWRGHLGLYGNLATKNPNCHARITDLQEPTTTTRVRG
jgi:hypothetical protein